MCRIAKVNRITYYRSLKPSASEIRRNEIIRTIGELQKQSDYSLGIFSMQEELRGSGIALSHNTVVEQISRTVRTMTYDMRLESVKLMLAADRAEELYLAHEKLFRILRERDVEGVYGEIRSTYFVPDAENQVIALSEKV